MRRNPTTDLKACALVVVDLQRYYVERGSTFSLYSEARYPGVMDYIAKRCETTVLPNVGRLLEAFRGRGCAVIFLRLCGIAEDRSDLHPQFMELHNAGLSQGFADVYPLQSDPWSEVSPVIAPLKGEQVFCKTTYSAFTSSPIHEWLQASGIRRLTFTGLATSQCVETTARDAADRGYEVALVEDALADYEEITHRASLFASRAVCGGGLYETDGLLGWLEAVAGT
jgi:nicotinamidase-related amidase